MKTPPVKTYKIRDFEFRDVDGDGKLSTRDEILLPGTHKPISGGEFLSYAYGWQASKLISPDANLNGVTYSKLQTQAKKFLPDGKLLAKYMKVPVSLEDALSKNRAKEFSAALVHVSPDGNSVKILIPGYAIAIQDRGAIEFFRQNGFSIARLPDQKDHILAYKFGQVRDAIDQRVGLDLNEKNTIRNEFISRFKVF